MSLLLPSLVNAQEVGLQLYSLRKQFEQDIPGTLAQVAEWEIRAIEGGGTYGLPLVEYKQLLAENHLSIISVGADFDLLTNDPEAVLQNARAFNARYAVCFWIPHQGDQFTINEIKKAIKVFNKAGKMLAKEGVTLCYHPHGYEFRPYQQGTLFDHLARKTKPEYLSFEMDVYWVQNGGENPLALLKRYEGRFPLFHLKDRRPGTPGNPNGRTDVECNVVLGTGDVDIAGIVAEAKRQGAKYFFLEDESSRSVQQIPESLRYLESLK